MNKFFKLLFAGALVLAGASALSLALPKDHEEVRATEAAGTYEDPYYATTFEELAYAVEEGHKDYIIVNEFEEDDRDVEGYYYVNPDYSKYSFNEMYQNHYFFFWQERSYHLTINCDIKIRQSVRHLNIRYLFYVSSGVNLTLDGTGSITFKIDEDGYYRVGIFETHRDSNITINGDLTFAGIHENPKSTTYAFSTDQNSHVVVNGGHFIGTGPSGYNGSHAFEYTCRNGSTLLINGGDFVVADDIVTTTPTASLVIFDQDAANANNITIKGGTFHGICVRNKNFNILDIVDPEYQLVREDTTPFEEADATATREVLTCEALPPTNYTVSFNANGGTGTMDDEPVHTRTYLLPACTFEHANALYAFRGWSINSADGELYQPGETISISSNLTLYAVWSEMETWVITYGDAQGNSFSFSLLEGTHFEVWSFEVTSFKAPVGKRFSHWKENNNHIDNINPGDDYVVPDDNLYFMAQYVDTGETVVYISFDNGGGEGSMDQIPIVAGKNYVLPTNKVFTNGSAPFRGWYVPGIGLMNPLDIFRVTRSISITAVWGEPVALEIVHPGINQLNHDVTYDEIEAYVIFEDGSKDLIDAQSQVTFYRKNDSEEFVEVDLMNCTQSTTGEREFKAMYQGLECYFTIKFGNYCPMFFVSGLNDGRKVVLKWLEGETNVIPDYPFELPEATEFHGWNDAYGVEYNVGEGYIADKSNTFYPRLFGTKHTLYLYKGDGDGTMASKLVYQNSNFYLPKSTFTPPLGKEFDHWEIDGVVYSPETAYKYTWSDDVTAFAIYREKAAITYLVSYDANGGEGSIGAQELATGTSYKLPSNSDFTAPEGYQFDHWLVKIGSNDPVAYGPNDSFAIEDNTLIMPVWAPQLTSISVSGTYKTEYEIGESFDDTGIVVTGHYFDSTEDSINLWEVEFTGFDSSSAGTKTITVSYGGKTTTIQVTVLAAKYSVAYAPNGGTGSNYVVNNVVDGSEYTLVEFATTGFIAPEGKEFDCWLVGEVEKQPGQTITVTSNTTIQAKWKDAAPQGGGEGGGQGGGEVTPETPETSTTPTTPDTPATPEQPQEHKGLSGGAIAGIVIGSVAVAGLGGFAIFWFVIKKKTFADLLAVFSKK